MNNPKNLIKECLVCTLLGLPPPGGGPGTDDGYIFERLYGQPVSEAYPYEDKSEDAGNGLPCWGWAILVWIVLDWMFCGDDSGGSWPAHQDKNYVIAPIR